MEVMHMQVKYIEKDKYTYEDVFTEQIQKSMRTTARLNMMTLKAFE